MSNLLGKCGIQFGFDISQLCIIIMRCLLVIIGLCALWFASSDASPYNKYGRSCKDILCTVREECVMERDACTAYSEKCGAYPTCKRKAGSATGCAAMRCPSGHFCSIRQEACGRPPCEIKPTCIAFRTPAPSTVRSGSNTYSSLSKAPSTQYNQQTNRRSWSFDRISG